MEDKRKEEEMAEEEGVRYRWVDVDPSDLRPGDVARGLDREGRFGVDTGEAEVTSETIDAHDDYVYLAGSGGWDRGRQWQRREVVPATPEEYSWVPIEHDALQEGMYVRGTRSGADPYFGEVAEGVVSRLDDRTATLAHDSRRYSRFERTWERRSEPPARILPDVEALPEASHPVAAPDGGAPLPTWATSLDAARRYVHAQAIELWRDERNCWDGTADFLGAADLPTEEEWPIPDGTAEIREFLTQVREAALETAEGHGKSIYQVETWLSEHGITAPPPALTEHTVTFQAPADANVRQVLVDLGWVVRD